jgi:MFS family permease
MSKIILIGMLINVVNIFMLYFVGRISDRTGNRRPLAVISTICAASMLLWVASAWWGLWVVIAFQIINGMAGSTHWMLLTNLSLEVYPAKGRPNYLSFSRTLVGLMLMAGATVAGYVMSGIRGWEIILWGARFNHYHVFFLGCAVFTLGCLIPLWFLGRMKMPEAGQPLTEDAELLDEQDLAGTEDAMD